MEISERSYEGFKIICLSGRFDAHNADTVESHLEKIFSSKVSKLIIDVKNLTYLSSCGIRIFIAVTQRLREIGGKYAILQLNTSIRNILKGMEIDRLFNFFNDEQAAVEFLKS